MPNNTASLRNNKIPFAAKLIFALILIISAIAIPLSFVFAEMWILPPLLVMLSVGLYEFGFTDPCDRLKSMIALLISDAIVFGTLTILRIKFPVYFARISSLFLIGIVIQIFTVTGLMFILISTNTLIRQSRKCTVAVKGVVLDYKLSCDKNGETYSPLYEYSYNGTVYQGYQGIYTHELNPPVGGERKIYIDPEYPEDIFDKKPYIESYIFKCVFGTAFIMGGLLATATLGMC